MYLQKSAVVIRCNMLDRPFDRMARNVAESLGGTLSVENDGVVESPPVHAVPEFASSQPAAAQVTEAEGMQLHLSSTNDTGYKAVKLAAGRFHAQHRMGNR